ncbi:hypothetical protein J2Y48_002826 [Mycoplana sp. BE70]|nr:hypothetical protein [Mycoplana sp. BE70]
MTDTFIAGKPDAPVSMTNERKERDYLHRITPQTLNH